MTDEVQTTQYRNVSGHLADLEGGRMVEAGGFVDLSDDEVRDNRDRLDEGFIKVEPVEQEPEPFNRAAAMERAKELEISGYSRMRNDELQTAIIEAEQNQEGDGS